MQNIQFEKDLNSKGIRYIAGVDEVGRGALAGPMVVAAVVLDVELLLRNNATLLRFANNATLLRFANNATLPRFTNNDVLSADFKLYSQINDSKLVSAKKRAVLDHFIRNVAITFGIVEISNDELDKIGLSKATQVGFENSIKALKINPEHVLTDAFEIKSMAKESQTNLIGGDKLSISIAAASIVAKVYRDTLMTNIHNNHKEYTCYQFDVHKGYGTKMHIEKIREFGMSNLHRKSFNINNQ